MASNDDDYPEDKIFKNTRAFIKPDERVVCRRCPNADWVEEFTDTEYGTDTALRAYCTGLGGQWIWPLRNVGGCSSRRRAIDAERSA